MSTEDQLSLFAGDSPASPILSPGNEEARKMTEHSGKKCIESYAKYSPLGSLVRMLLGSSAWNSTTCFLTWKTRVTPRKHLYFQLVPSMPDTVETESSLSDTEKGGGLWPTPAASQAGAGEFLQDLKTKDGRPAQPGERAYSPGAKWHSQITLNRAVHLWPTPTSREYKGARSKEAMEKSGRNPMTNTLSDSVEAESGYQTPEGKLSGSLSPMWVEWLMGYPIGWTDSKD